MLTRRHLFVVLVSGALAGTAAAGQEKKSATVTLIVEGMT